MFNPVLTRIILQNTTISAAVRNSSDSNNLSCKQKKDCSSKRNSLFSKPSIKKAIVPGFYSIPL